jgi:hypothetical protein
MRRSLTLRRSLAALALPLLLGGMAACGSDDEGADPAALSSSSTESGESSETESGEEVDTATFVEDMKAGIEASTTAMMTTHTDMGGQVIHADGAVDYTTTPQQLAVSLESPALLGVADVRLVDGVLYMNLGEKTKDKFISFDLSDAANLMPGMEQLTTTMDPLAAFESLEDAVQSVVFVGDEDVEGEQLGHYEVELDTSKIKQFNELPTQAQLPKTVTYDVWLDDENRMRRVTMEMDMGGSPAETEVEFTDWDEPVDIAAPPASEVVDPSELAG